MARRVDSTTSRNRIIVQKYQNFLQETFLIDRTNQIVIDFATRNLEDLRPS